MLNFPLAQGFGLLGQGIFFLLLLIFAIYTLFLAYHWFSYGTSKATAINALVVYLAVGAFLFLGLIGSIV